MKKLITKRIILTGVGVIAILTIPMLAAESFASFAGHEENMRAYLAEHIATVYASTVVSLAVLFHGK